MAYSKKIMVALFLVIAAVFGCALVALLFWAVGGQVSQPTPYAPQPSPPGSNGDAGAGGGAGNGTPSVTNVEKTWALIYKANVEKACIASAKDEAAAQGYGTWVVSGCSCTVLEESEGRKAYDCKVSALDGNHPLSIDCRLSLLLCTVVSEKGALSYGFEQLQAMAERG